MLSVTRAKITFASSNGEVAEWSNALVLKTSEGHTSGGSNPSFSAYPGYQNVPKCSKPTFWAFFLPKRVYQNAPKCTPFGWLSGLTF